MKILVHLIPNTSQTEIVSKDLIQGWRIRITEPAIDGRANEALIRVIADDLHVAPSRIRILRGHTSRKKWLEIS